MRSPALLLVALLAPAAAQAADITVELRTPSGRPVSGAVVTFHPAAGHKGQPKGAGPYRVVQQNIQFAPGLLVAPVGTDVSFPNKDKVRHHVYSFSPAKKFELKLYGREEARTVKFDKPGVVALGCNIHDSMKGHVYVVDTPFLARSGESGHAVVAGVPTGAGKLTVWHPNLKNPNVGVVRTVPAGAGRQTVVLELRGG